MIAYLAITNFNRHVAAILGTSLTQIDLDTPPSMGPNPWSLDDLTGSVMPRQPALPVAQNHLQLGLRREHLGTPDRVGILYPAKQWSPASRPLFAGTGMDAIAFRSGKKLLPDRGSPVIKPWLAGCGPRLVVGGRQLAPLRCPQIEALTAPFDKFPKGLLVWAHGSGLAELARGLGGSTPRPSINQPRRQPHNRSADAGQPGHRARGCAPDRGSCQGCGRCP